MSWLDEYAKIEEKARRGAGLLDRLGYGDNGKDRSASALHQEYVYRRMSDIAAKPIVWLWEGRIPRGKVSMVAGHPGLGKSQLTLSVAAIVSVGGMWPVDRTQCDAGSVIILSGEDDAEDTIRPRLEATGADLRRIYILDSVRDTNQHGEPFNRPFTLSAEDILRLRAMIAHLGEVALVVIDPVSAYLGVVDSHRNSEVREVLTLLADMAADTGVAVLCVSHLNKAGGPEALMRVMGSLGFVAAARSAYLVAKDPEDGDRRLFLPMKNNLAVDTGGMAFRVRPQDLGRGIHTSCVEWDSEQVTITADEALAPVGDPEERSDLEDAKAFLRVLLCDGPVPSKECIARAKEDGISVITLRRAKKYLKINSEKQFGTGKWVWVSRACASETRRDQKRPEEKSVPVPSAQARARTRTHTYTNGDDDDDDDDDECVEDAQHDQYFGLTRPRAPGRAVICDQFWVTACARARAVIVNPIETVRVWLVSVGETNEDTIEETLERCRRDPSILAAYLRGCASASTNPLLKP